MRVYNVEQIPTHGGSLRIYGCRSTSKIKQNKSVYLLLQKEKNGGLLKINKYKKLQEAANKTKNDLKIFI